jgi:hypothetical protein
LGGWGQKSVRKSMLPMHPQEAEQAEEDSLEEEMQENVKSPSSLSGQAPVWHS